MKKDLHTQLVGKQLFIVHGDSHVLKTRAVETIVSERLSDEDREFGLTRVLAREADLGQITGAFSSGSLFATEQVIVLQELDAMQKPQQQRLVPALKTIGPGTTLVITASPSARASSDPNLSAPLVKLAKENGLIINCNTPFYAEWKDELSPWVRTELERHGKAFGPGALQCLIDMVGADADRLANEITKLVIYIGDAPTITVDDVRTAASPTQDQDIFGLTDAIGNRNAAKALNELAALLPAHAKRGSAIPVLAMITRHLRLLWQARLLIDNNISLLSSKDCPEHIIKRLPKEQNIFDGVRNRRPIARRYAEQARNFSNPQLAKAMVETFRTDLALKGQGTMQMDDHMLLETLILTLCRR